MIAFLGTGLLGANFVRAFAKRNEDVQVWNRTPEKAPARWLTWVPRHSTTRPTRCAVPVECISPSPTMLQSTRCWSRRAPGSPKTPSSSTTPPPHPGLR